MHQLGKDDGTLAESLEGDGQLGREQKFYVILGIGSILALVLALLRTKPSRRRYQVAHEQALIPSWNYRMTAIICGGTPTNIMSVVERSGRNPHCPSGVTVPWPHSNG